MTRTLIALTLLSSALAYGQISGAGQIGCNGTSVTGTAWTSATANNTTQILASNVAGTVILVTLDQTTTLTAGAINFQVDPGDGNFVTVQASQVLDPTSTTFATISLPYTLQASTNKQFAVYMLGATRLQLKLTTAITGTGSITPNTVIACYQSPNLTNLIGPLPTGTNTIGKFDILGNAGATLDSAPQATAPTNVLGIGAAAVNAEQTAATNGQAQRIVTDLVGKLIALPYANPENFVSGTNSATGTGSTAIIAAEGSGVRTYVTACQVTNTSATNSSVSIEDGSTVLTVISAPANAGAIVQFPTPLRGTANTALNSVAGTGVTTLFVSCSGYKGQ